MNISELFALMKVNQLKELAMKHNVLVGIKAPSEMLKAELVKTLSEHYYNLVGTELLPVPPKKLEIPRLQIPPKYQEKKRTIKKLTAEEQKKKMESKTAVQEYEKKQKAREKRNKKYYSEEGLEAAKERRETREKRRKWREQRKKELAKQKLGLSAKGTELFNRYIAINNDLRPLTGQEADEFNRKLFKELVMKSKILDANYRTAKAKKELTNKDIEMIEQAKNLLMKTMNMPEIANRF